MKLLRMILGNLGNTSLKIAQGERYPSVWQSSVPQRCGPKLPGRAVRLAGGGDGLGLAQSLRQLISAGGGTVPAGIALKKVDHLVGWHALDQLADGQQVAGAAARELDALDRGAVVAQLDVNVGRADPMGRKVG